VELMKQDLVSDTGYVATTLPEDPEIAAVPERILQLDKVRNMSHCRNQALPPAPMVANSASRCLNNASSPRRAKEGPY
jgi:hypothetical protein